MGDVVSRWEKGAAGTENGDVAPSSDQTGKGIFLLLEVFPSILLPAGIRAGSTGIRF